MKAEVHSHSLDERFVFTGAAKKLLLMVLGIGVVSLILGILTTSSGGGEHGAINALNDTMASNSGGASEAHGEGFSWVKRLFANLWINNVYFTGISVIGLFFVSVNYVGMAGWSAGLKRIPEAFTAFLPISLILMLGVFAVSYHDIFHWTHEGIMDKASPNYDKIIAGKEAFLNLPFYLSRMVIFIGGWAIFAFFLRKQSIAEDLNGGTAHYRKMVRLSAGFIVFFGVSSSMSAWDWVMSIDTHWFSTMFGWYVFASWFVSGLAGITLVVVLLKEAGYLHIINENHLHDMGKFVFAFSIFWTYIWFSQFLLIYYANIPEETIYFVERLKSDVYSKYIFINLFLNFFFPFLGLMTRDAKRKMILLKIVCTIVLVGHWFDFFLMITPGTLKENGGFGFMEIGVTLIYLVVFLFVMLNMLSRQALIAKNHPMIEESIHHHI